MVAEWAGADEAVEGTEVHREVAEEAAVEDMEEVATAVEADR